jgi:hypothetical protein
MSLTLRSYKTKDRERIAIYEGRHSNSAEGSPGTTLTFEVTLTKRSEVEPWVATIQFDNCDAVLPRDAIDRLAGWCARAAQALKRDASFWNNSNELPLGDYP